MNKSILVAAMVAVALTACGEQKPAAPAPAPAPAPPAAPPPPPPPPPPGGGAPGPITSVEVRFLEMSEPLKL